MASKKASNLQFANKAGSRGAAATAGVDAEAAVIDAINELAGDRVEAERWFRTQKIPGYGGLTLEQVVKKLGASSAISYIEGMKAGVFA